MDSVRRIALLGVLIGLVFGVNFLYVGLDFRSYPSTDEIIGDQRAVNGHEVFVFEEVELIDHDRQRITIVLEDEYFAGLGLGGVELETRDQHELTVFLANASVIGTIEDGSYLQIHGTLRDDSTVIDAQSVIVEHQHKGDWVYSYGISLIGAFIALLFFFRHWKITRTGFVLRRDA